MIAPYLPPPCGLPLTCPPPSPAFIYPRLIPLPLPLDALPLKPPSLPPSHMPLTPFLRQVFIVVRCQNRVGLYVEGYQEGGIRRDDSPPSMQGTVFDRWPRQSDTDYEYTYNRTATSALWYGWTQQYAPLGGIYYSVSPKKFDDVSMQPDDIVWLNYSKVLKAGGGAKVIAKGRRYSGPGPVAVAAARACVWSWVGTGGEGWG